MYVKIKFTDGKCLRGHFLADNVRLSDDGIQLTPVGIATVFIHWCIVRKLVIKWQKPRKGGNV